MQYCGNFNPEPENLAFQVRKRVEKASLTEIRDMISEATLGQYTCTASEKDIASVARMLKQERGLITEQRVEALHLIQFVVNTI